MTQEQMIGTQALVAAAAAAAVADDQAAAGVIGVTDGPMLQDEDLPTSAQEEEETELVSMDLPLALMPPNVNDARSIWRIQIYSKDCLDCPALIPFKESDPEAIDVAHAKCHYNRGNTLCPASQMQVISMGQVHKWAQRLVEARQFAAQGDPLKLNEVISKISEQVKKGKISEDELKEMYVRAGLAAEATL